MIGLVLQGGGALGAFELGVIECLLDKKIVPDVVSGVSIGAINAAVLAAGRHADPRVGMRAMWAEFTTLTLPPPFDAANGEMSLFGNPGMYSPRLDYINVAQWKNFYCTWPLWGTLAKHVDFSKLKPKRPLPPPEGRAAPRLILTATNLESGVLDSFDSDTMEVSAAHVVASCSLAPMFPMTSAPAPGGRPTPYWDGGLFDNTPLSTVIHALQDSGAPKRTLYVVTLFPAIVPLPRNMQEVITRIQTLSLSNRMDKDLHRARRSTKIIQLIEEIDRLVAQHPELEALTHHPGYLAVKERKEIEFIEIVNQHLDGPHDFSAAAIEERRRRGYAAAEAKIH